MFSAEVWNLNTWTFKGFDGEGGSKGWAYDYTDTDTWEPASTTVASFELAKGDTVYFQPSDAVSGLTVSGEVSDPSSATWTLAANEWIGDIMNPYPIDTTLADLESFAKASDAINVFSTAFWNLITYTYKGAGNGWACDTFSDETWEATSYSISAADAANTVVLPAGIGGCFQPSDMDGRTWTVTLK